MTRIAVIGRGLMGSAAAKYLAEMGHDVLLIGPDEPVDKRTHQGVFASHYDEGRITRRLATDAFWSTVSSASIARYRDIEAASGIPFYTPCGAMMAGPADHAFTNAAAEVRQALGIDSRDLNGEDLAEAFPFFAFPTGTRAFHEVTGGHISPRALVRAQTRIAEAFGATLVPEVATAIAETTTGVTITTASDLYTVENALIATGAMTDHLAPQTLGQRVYARTVAFFEVTEDQAALLAAMPTLVFRRDDLAGEPYLLPPIRYPDGRWHLKLGGDPVDRMATTADQIADWFRSGGDADVRDHLAALIHRLMPDLQVEATTMEACVTTFTPSGYPAIDRLTDRIAVASGGNGAGAKCSDELGRIAAHVTAGLDHPNPLTRLPKET